MVKCANCGSVIDEVLEVTLPIYCKACLSTTSVPSAEVPVTPPEVTNLTLRELVEHSHAMAKEKGFWSKSQNIPEKLMLIVSELGEACEALRHNRRQVGFNWQKDTFEDEIADTFIRLADLCGRLDINIEWQIHQKSGYNRSREKLHGKEF